MGGPRRTSMFTLQIWVGVATACYVTMDADPTIVRGRCPGVPRNDLTTVPTYMNTQESLVVAGARCCSQGAAASVCTNWCDVYNFTDARDLCLALGPGWDLCSVADIEAGMGVGTGCKYDSMHVWTSTECTAPPTPTPTPAPSATPAPTGVCLDGVDYHEDAEHNNILVMELEKLILPNTNWRWEQNQDFAGYSGASYAFYNGNVNSVTPKYRMKAYIQLNTAGLHRFMCRGYVDSDDFTVRNDFWLRFKGDNVQALFGARDLQDQSYKARKHACGNGLEPDGSDTLPYVSGCDWRNDGFIKVYNPNQDTRTWNWKSKTSDFDARDVYLQVSQPGKVTMQIAARSKFAIDRCVMYPVDDNMTFEELEVIQIEASNLTLAETIC